MNSKIRNLFRGALLLALALCLTAGLAISGAQAEQPAPLTVSLPEETAAPQAGMTSERAAEGYIARIMAGAKASSRQLQANATGESLTGAEAKLYAATRKKIAQVAAGELSDTRFQIPLTEVFDQLAFTAADLGVDHVFDIEGSNANFNSDAWAAFNEKTAVNFSAVTRCLLYDCPYEMYWYDKTAGCGFSKGSISGTFGSVRADDTICFADENLTYSFYVSSDYSVGGVSESYTFDTSFSTRTAAAAAAARKVVSDNAGKGDVAKLTAYKEYICGAVDYNDEAANNAATPYGDPWQLVNVFDGDESTKVVCEGYSKAFQFLCDESAFAGNVSVVSVSGTMSGGTGSGPHMWNIVALGGQNLIADVTNSDDGSVGWQGDLFLKGYTRKVSEKEYVFLAGSTNIDYVYNDDTVALIGGSGLLAITGGEEVNLPTLAAPTLTYEAYPGDYGVWTVSGVPNADVGGKTVVWTLTVRKVNEDSTYTTTITGDAADGSFSTEVFGWEYEETIICTATCTVGDETSEAASITIEQDGAPVPVNGPYPINLDIPDVWEEGLAYSFPWTPLPGVENQQMELQIYDLDEGNDDWDAYCLYDGYLTEAGTFSIPDTILSAGGNYRLAIFASGDTYENVTKYIEITVEESKQLADVTLAAPIGEIELFRPFTVTINTVPHATAYYASLMQKVKEEEDGGISWETVAEVRYEVTGDEGETVTLPFTEWAENAAEGIHWMDICAIADGYRGSEVDFWNLLVYQWAEPIYTWSADNSNVTATRVRTDDASYVETETVSTTSEITKAATCETKGETTYTSAAFENTGFTVQTKTVDIPELGHAWGAVTYTWNADNSKVTATRICTRDEKHQETETAETVSSITKQPTFEQAGETTYTAEFENTAFETQTKTIANIPKLDYNWSSPTYTWSDDYSKVTARRVSSTDASVDQTETVETTGKVTREATCTQKGETTYTSAAFTNEAFEIQIKAVDNIPANGHTMTAHAKVDATCTEAGTEAYWECSVCHDLFADQAGKNRIDEPVIIASKGHDWSEPTYTWNADNSKVTAARTCAHDAEHVETEEVNAGIGLVKAPTEKEAGAYQIVSQAFENPAFEIQTKEISIPALNEMNVLRLPDGLKSIKAEAFEGVSADAVIVPDGCMVIESMAFVNCPHLLYVRIPADTEIAEDAFTNCPNVILDRK